jgi:S1-C subfamily serine protease
VGFAIPINLIAHIVPQLISRGRVVRPEIGITKVYQTEEGLLIADLTKDGPAERAGLRGPQLTRKRRGPFTVERLDRNSADLIAEVDGTAVKTGDDFLGLIERKEPGQQVTLTIVREGRKMRVAVRLAGGEEPGPAPGPAPR